jgi:cytoskeleton protein RodZ
VTDGDPGTSTPQKLADAGEWLRMAREQAGLSIDTVSQQLKLAPRQVKALEDGNFAELPGRTFVRGFVRNYARLLRLDPEAVVAALPDAEAAPALEGPSIGSTSRPMGELPVAGASRGASWSRWAIPVALIVAVAVAAVYEFMRPGGEGREGASAPAPVRSDAASTPISGGGTPLPNPVTGATPAEPARADDGRAAADSAPAPAPSAASDGGAGAPAAPAAQPPAPAPGDATLVIRYNKSAWTQVRDANGQTLLITNGEPGGTQTVTGKPPLDVVLGNASDTSIQWRGQPFDLAPHIKGNVARVRLP